MFICYNTSLCPTRSYIPYYKQHSKGVILISKEIIIVMHLLVLLAPFNCSNAGEAKHAQCMWAEINQ